MFGSPCEDGQTGKSPPSAPTQTSGRGRREAPSLGRGGRPSPPRPGGKPYQRISAEAPASSSFALTWSASSLGTASRTGLGAASTRSLDSLRPRPVISRTALITLTLASPMAVSTTVNSVCSSGAATSAAAEAAAALMPSFSSMSFTALMTSSTLHDGSASTNSSGVMALVAMMLVISWIDSIDRISRKVGGAPGSGGLELLPVGVEGGGEVGRDAGKGARQLSERGLERAGELGEQDVARWQLGEGLHPAGVQHLPLDEAGDEGQPAVDPVVVAEDLGRDGELPEPQGQSHGTVEDRAELADAGLLGGPAGEGVLGDLVVDPLAPQLGAQLLELLDRQAPVVGDDGRGRPAELLGEALHRRPLAGAGALGRLFAGRGVGHRCLSSRRAATTALRERRTAGVTRTPGRTTDPTCAGV